MREPPNRRDRNMEVLAVHISWKSSVDQLLNVLCLEQIRQPIFGASIVMSIIRQWIHRRKVNCAKDTFFGHSSCLETTKLHESANIYFGRVTGAHLLPDKGPPFSRLSRFCSCPTASCPGTPFSKGCSSTLSKEGFSVWDRACASDHDETSYCSKWI